MSSIDQRHSPTLLQELLRVHLDKVKAAAGVDFYGPWIRWFPVLVFCTMLAIVYTWERLPSLQTPITPLPNGPHAIGILLVGYGLLNLVLALCVSATTPRLILSVATAIAYVGMLGAHYAAGQTAWRAVFAINLFYALFAGTGLSFYLSESRFKTVFLLQILATLVGIQGPLALFNLTPLSLLQTAPFGFDGWILFLFPMVLLVFSPLWAMFGSGIRIAFLLLLPPILIGYSFVHLSQTLAMPSLSVFGLGGSGLLLFIIVRILTASLREKKITDDEKPNTQSI